MLCPACKSSSLMNAELEAGLFSWHCEKCAGTLLNLSAYDGWIKTHASMTSREENRLAIEACESKHALHCPKCQGLMLKFRIGAGAERNLDFCFNCEEVWLDGGEWRYLKTLGLHTRIRTVSTDAWQHRIRDTLTAQARIDRLQALIGEDAWPVVAEFRDWLSTQAARSDILRYLNQPE